MVFMLLFISFAAAMNTTYIEKKESPLYGIRIREAIGIKIMKIIDKIQTKFLCERIFFLPFQGQINRESYSLLQRIFTKDGADTCGGGYSCCYIGCDTY